ncbi:MAG: hypothetical protein P0Y60_00940 [Candidatus Microbacterium colombiense]|nr:MAG: hypothetical protein P0Y60_00940 [Microbacterium sp.]
MPTKSPRTHITHTPQVLHALDVARTRWPDEDRESALILHLLDEGAKSIEEHREAADAYRADRIRALAGKHSAHYGSGYLDELRAEWDE